MKLEQTTYPTTNSPCLQDTLSPTRSGKVCDSPHSQESLELLGEKIRKDFPIYQREDEARASLPLSYLDNAATTQRLGSILEAMKEHYERSNANPYRGVYRDSLLATAEYEQTRIEIADFVGADPDEIIFTRNTTEGLNLVAYTYALDHLHPGDTVVLPISEHHSNLVPWQRICSLTGANLVYLELDETGRLNRKSLDIIDEHVKIVACAHISNVLGTIFPLQELAQRAHRNGAVLVADCAQSAAHLPLDLHKMQVDFAAFSGHKMYGPTGIGVLYVKRDLLETMDPFLLGGEMVDSVWDHRTSFLTGPRRFEAGTPNIDGALGLRCAVRYLQDIGLDAIVSHEQSLAKYLLDNLAALPQVRILGNNAYSEDRLGIVSFNIDSVDPHDAALFLDARNVCIRTGSHCAQPLHRHLGVEQSCRVSLGIYNTKKDIDLFLNALEGLRGQVTRRIMGMFP